MSQCGQKPSKKQVTEFDMDANFQQYPQKENKNIYKDILSLTALLNKIEQNLKIQSELKDKDLVLILGITGTGKSLLTNKLCGLNIIEIGHELQLEQPQNAISQIGNQMLSQTKKIYFTRSENGNQTLYICDTPGLLDDIGFEDDIINSFIILRAIKNAKSLRLILMFTPEQYSWAGRGDSLKKAAFQYSQLLSQFEKYEDSIIISFNFIKISEEKTKIDQALYNMDKIKNALKDDEITKKKFIEMLIRKVQQKKYFIFDPLQKNDYLNYLKQIHSLKPINKDDIKKYIKYSLNYNSSVSLEYFLTKCIDTLKECVKDCDYESSVQIIKAFAILKKNIKLIQVKHQCEKLLDEIKSQNKIIETFQLSFESFCKIQVFDQTQFIQLIQIISKTLNIYLLIEQAKLLSKDDMKLESPIKQITSFINQKLYEIYDSQKSSNDIQFKLIQIKKLMFLLESKELKNIYEIANKMMKSLNIVLSEDMFSLDLQQKINRDLEQNYKFILDKINEIKQNQNLQNSKNIQILLNNIQYISENGLVANSQIKINYMEIKFSFQQMITSFIQEIVSIKVSINNHNQNNQIQYCDRDLHRRKDMNRKYKFIQFFCSSEGTGVHFQDKETKLLFSGLKERIKQAIKFYSTASQIQKLYDSNEILSIHLLISDLSNLDDTINQEINNDQNYIQYEAFLKNICFKKIQIFQEQFKNIKDQINLCINDNQQDKLPLNLFQDIQKNIKDLFQCRSLIKQIPIFQQVQKYYHECEKDFSQYIYELENQILYEKSKFIINFKKLQALVYFNMGYNILVHENISDTFDFYNRQVKFIKFLQKWISEMIETQNFKIVQEISLQNLNYMNENIFFMQEGLQFFINFKELLVPHIQIIQQKLVNSNILLSEIKQEDEDILTQKSKPQFINQGYVSFMSSIDQEIQQIKKRLNQIQDDLLNKFYESFEVNLKTLDGLFEVKQFEQIIRLLDKLREIQQGSLLKVKEFIGENIYDQVQKKIMEILQNQLDNIQSMRINHTSLSLYTYQDELNSFKKNKELVKDHLSPNIKLVFESEELKIKFFKQKIDENAVNLILNNNFQEAWSLMKSLDDSKQKEIKGNVTKHIDKIIENIKSYIRRFEKECSLELQDEIMRNIIIAQDAFKYFNVNNSNGQNTQDQIIQTHFMNFANKLVEKLFLSFDSSINIDKLLIKTLFLSFNQNLNRINFNVSYFNKHLKGYISNKFQEVCQRLQQECHEFNIIERANTLKSIYDTMKELNFEFLFKTKEFENQFNLLKQSFLNQITDQTELFIHQQNDYDSKDIKDFIKYQYNVVFDFFVNNKDKVDKFIKNFINNQQVKFDNLKKDIQNKNIKNIQQHFSKHKKSILIKNKIQNMLHQMEQNIICKYLPQDDFVQLKDYLNILQSFSKFFVQTQQDNDLFKYISSIEQNIANKILDIWIQFKNQQNNLSENIKLILSNLVKISNIIDLCEIEKVQKEINYKSLIELMINTLKLKKAQIQESINSLNPDCTIKLYIGSINIQNEVIIFQKKKRNYCDILTRVITQQSNSSQIYHQHNALIQEFKKNNLFQVFQQIIQSKKNSLTDSLKQLYRSKQYEIIIEEQKQFNQFAIKLNQIQEFIQKQDYFFMYEYIEKNYKDEFEKANKISKNKELQLQEITRILMQLELLEQHFSEYSKEIKINQYSKQVKQFLLNNKKQQQIIQNV